MIGLEHLTDLPKNKVWRGHVGLGPRRCVLNTLALAMKRQCKWGTHAITRTQVRGFFFHVTALVCTGTYIHLFICIYLHSYTPHRHAFTRTLNVYIVGCTIACMNAQRHTHMYDRIDTVNISSTCIQGSLLLERHGMDAVHVDVVGTSKMHSSLM